jgi:hypothetical protein
MGGRVEYPNDFDTPVFPAGRNVALSRRFAVWISVCFFLIVCACGFLLYFSHLKRNYPFLVSVDPITNEWTVIAYPGKDFKDTINQYQIVQEKLVYDFVDDWFTISQDNKANDARWQKCDIDNCSNPEQYNPFNAECSLFCKSDEKLFDLFASKVLPEYRARLKQKSERWSVGRKNIIPNYTSENGGFWQVFVPVYSTVNGWFNVLVFVTIARSTDSYPATLGYYVQDFNACRITQ